MRGQGKRASGAPQGAEGLSDVSNNSSDANSKAPKVDAEKLKASMDRLFSIYSDISDKADDVMVTRCPYKDARSRCTARFECRNQFFTKNPSEKPVCAGSDKIDYRSAWVNGGADESML